MSGFINQVKSVHVTYNYSQTLKELPQTLISNKSQNKADRELILCDVKSNPYFPPSHRFICLRVRLIPFSSSAASPPGSFEVVLSSRTKVFSLIRIIQDRVGIQTSMVEVFRRRLPTEKACLPPESTLEECGFKGGPEESPTEETVYYDFRLLFTDCPLLNCDHYFRSKPDSAARWTESC